MNKGKKTVWLCRDPNNKYCMGNYYTYYEKPIRAKQYDSTSGWDDTYDKQIWSEEVSLIFGRQILRPGAGPKKVTFSFEKELS